MIQLKEKIKNILFFVAGLSLLTISWIFFLDGMLSYDWRNFEIIGSVVACIAVYSILHFVIMYFVPFNFLVEKILECFTVVLLWFGFGYFFDWYDYDNWYFVFIYALPAYAIMYFWDLYTLKKDADYVNEKIGKENI